MKDIHTIKSTDPNQYSFLQMLYDVAVQRVSSPEFVRVSPPPDSKTPYDLLNVWGLEMLQMGLDMAEELTELLKDE